MTLVQVELKNHPGYWLEPASAAAFERMEAAHGSPFSISDAGRTIESQQNLIDRWNIGGPANRPPNLYLPAMPASASPHTRGTAVDVNNGDDRAWIKAHPEYGWYYNIVSDVVHMVYDPNRDTHKNDAPPTGGASTPSIQESEDDMKIFSRETATPAGPGQPNVQFDFVIGKQFVKVIPDAVTFGKMVENYGAPLTRYNDDDFERILNQNGIPVSEFKALGYPSGGWSVERGHFTEEPFGSL